MLEVVVIATPATAPGFRLGGARTLTARDPEQTVARVALLTKNGGVAVIAVHGALWAAVPRHVREGWEKQTTPLVIALPDEDGDVGAARNAALHDLLVRAVGYEITFAPQGGVR
ncbi:MAG: hypothetical protein GEU96_10340 [Propionibacteriales bacterium]|nr:hypothetical protein [Propionibacteriales bacterium]